MHQKMFKLSYGTWQISLSSFLSSYTPRIPNTENVFGGSADAYVSSFDKFEYLTLIILDDPNHYQSEWKTLFQVTQAFF